MIDYSVIIRTTGNAGEKYRSLLQAIDGLDPQPKEIIIVLPEGYELPTEQLGWETFYFSPKGMVIQRMYGIKMCKTQYALITDDDISFESDFVQKLYEPLVNGEYGISAGPLVEFFPEKGLSTIMATLIGAAVPTLLHKERYNTVLHTTGYSYNRKIEIRKGKLYETQSAAWTCFFADVAKLRSIHFEDELWLDKNGYSAHDDTAMFYKAWIRGVKSVIVADAAYKHLDAKTSTRGNKNVSFADGYNTYIFWHRFIAGEATNLLEKIWCKLCISYRCFSQDKLNLINCIRHRSTKEERKAYLSGIKEAKKWVKTNEYAMLPGLYEER